MPRGCRLNVGKVKSPASLGEMRECAIVIVHCSRWSRSLQRLPLARGALVRRGCFSKPRITELRVREPSVLEHFSCVPCQVSRPSHFDPLRRESFCSYGIRLTSPLSMAASGASTPDAVLFEARDKSVVLVDIPRSLEEAQVRSGAVPTRRIVSAEALTEPYKVPEPRYGDAGSRSQAAQVADLMTEAAMSRALEILEDHYEGPFCLPRYSATLPKTGVADDESHLIPSGACYIQSSVQDAKLELAQRAPTFDLIVLDPPWPNRSARRRVHPENYSTVRNLAQVRDLLLQVPVRTHLAADGLVAVWVTNKESLIDLMTSGDGIFASWGVHLVGEWTWLKITACGEPILPLESSWRKPWEKLLIARRIGQNQPEELPSARAIIAVPDTHSRKPNLRKLFEPFLARDYVGLEVFARNLTSGWWSLGDQVLQFQGNKHWVSPRTMLQEQET